MTTRNIIHIDEEKCDGCGLCVTACAEGAIQIIDGKAKLVNDVYCDGLGACIGDCPQDALKVIQREAPDFDEEAVERHLAQSKPSIASPLPSPSAGGGCPSSAMQMMQPAPASDADPDSPSGPSQLGHWPVQLMLVPPQAPFLQGADLLVCADCVPFTVPDFHSRYLNGRAVLVGCPKLDNLPHYYEKFKAIFAEAKPKKVTVLRMEVPCCGGLVGAVIKARQEVAPNVPLDVHILGIRGGCHEETVPPGVAPGGPGAKIEV